MDSGRLRTARPNGGRGLHWTGYEPPRPKTRDDDQLQNLPDDAKCYETICQLRWPEEVRCPTVARRRLPSRAGVRPKRRGRTIVVGAAFATSMIRRRRCWRGIRVWILCLHFMWLNLSNAQIAQGLGASPDDVQRMTGQLREGIVARQPEPALSGHKGPPEAVKKRPPGAPAEGRARARHLGERKTPDLRDDPAGRRGGHPDAGECPTSDDSSADPDPHRPRNARLYR